MGFLVTNIHCGRRILLFCFFIGWWQYRHIRICSLPYAFVISILLNRKSQLVSIAHAHNVTLQVCPKHLCSSIA